MAARLASYLRDRNIHYGWVVAAVTFLAMLATAGALGSAGVMIVPLEHEFGWRNADISSALAIRLLMYGVMGVFAAALMNRHGLRKVAFAALLFVSLGLIASLAVAKVWQLVLVWGFVVGGGAGMTALVLGATVATRWFAQRRGLVVGLMTASTATGQLVFQPLMAALTESFGWRAATGFVAGVLLLAMVLVVLLLRDYPEDLGLTPYGSETNPPRPTQSAGLGALLAAPFEALAEAGRTQTFWVLFFTFFICGASTNGLIQMHWVTLCADYGVAPVGAAGMLALIGVFDFVGTIASGWLSDKYDNRVLLFVFYGLRGLSLIFLPLTDFTFVGLSLFGVFYGLDWVATVPPTVKLAAARFGSQKANLVFGWIFAGHQLGAASAAFGAGFSRTEFATYLPALYVSGGLCLLAALLAARMPAAANASVSRRSA